MISFNPHENPVSIARAVMISPFVQTLMVFYEVETRD